MSGLPLQDDMDLSDPVESLLWALVKMNAKQGAPLMYPVPLMREQARALYDRGLRFHPEEQRSWFHPPSGADFMGGEWKDFPPSATRDAAAEAVSRMSPGMRSALRAELSKEVD